MGLFSNKQDQAEIESAASARRSRRARSTAGDGPLDPIDPLELQKRKARRRLIGAIALVAGAVVLLPMVFDSEPRSGNEDLAVEIPSQNMPFAPRIPASSSAVSAPAQGASQQNVLVPGAPAPSSVIAAPGAPLVSLPPAADVPPAPSETSVPVRAKADAKPKPAPGAASPKADDPRALAALEGKSVAPTSPSSSSSSFAVQIGAFASAEKVKELRDRLGAAGLKTYTENLTTPQGPRTRVRVGPYSTHDAAEQARERVKGLGLDGSVVSL
jgi:DedD protein